MRSHILGIGLLLCLPCIAALEVRVDPPFLSADDMLYLTITSDGDPAGSLDLTPLEQDFVISQRSTHVQTQWLNGTTHREQTTTVLLSPKHAGELTIPSLEHHGQRSLPIHVQVTPGKTAEDLGIEIVASVPNQPLYPGERARYQLDLYLPHELAVSGITANLPEIDHQPLLQLQDHQEQLTHRDGKLYRHFQVAGDWVVQEQQHLPPTSVSLQLLQQQKRGRFTTGILKQLQSNDLDITIATPPDAELEHMLVAEALTLEARWVDPKPVYYLDDAITREVSLHVTGQLDKPVKALLQQLVEQQKTPGMTVYADPPQLVMDTQGPVPSVKAQQRWIYIPSTTGELALPAIDLVWFDKATQHHASLPPKDITVIETPATTTAHGAVPASTLTNTLDPTFEKPPHPEHVITLLLGLLLFFAFGWLATVLGWYRDRCRQRATPRTQESPEPAWKELKKACKTQQSPHKIYPMLIHWAQQRWPDAQVVNATQLSATLGSPELDHQLQRLNRAHFDPQSETLDGMKLLKALQDALKRERRQSRSKPQPPPLP